MYDSDINAGAETFLHKAASVLRILRTHLPPRPSGAPCRGRAWAEDGDAALSD